MPQDLNRLRMRKLATAITRPTCWPALRHGVAPSVEHRQVLKGLDIDGVIDVGANRGQFTLLCRLLFPGVPVAAFEPIPSEAAVFRAIHGGRPEVSLTEAALGDAHGTATLHLSQSLDSSSLLPIGSRQSELFAGTQETGTIEVPLMPLDETLARGDASARRLLKIDVQGSELRVLHGGTRTLGVCWYVYVECSEVALYEGQALREDVERFLSGQGFALRARRNEHMADGDLIQADYLFERRSP